MSYSADYFTARESWRDWRIEAERLIELAHLSPGANILEIGCGGGGLLRLLRARGANAVGIDTLDVALNLARTRLAEEHSPLPLVHIAEHPVLPFANASFDAIIGQHVIEHLPNIDVTLAEWRRLLKAGGRIALATPNAHYPDPAHFADADHAHVFTPTELRTAFERAGFTIEHCSTIFPFLSRIRVLRAFGVIAYRLFQNTPHFAARGRTILISARR